jgi:hypothetical protein
MLVVLNYSFTPSQKMFSGLQIIQIDPQYIEEKTFENNWTIEETFYDTRLKE